MRSQLRLAAAVASAFACACAPNRDTDGPDGQKTDTDTGTEIAEDTTTDTATGPDTTPSTDTATPTLPVDCGSLPSEGPVSYTTFDISTQEDFDFDADGRLIYVDGGSMSPNLLGTDTSGSTSVVAVGLPDTRGISVLPDGNVAVALFADGRIIEVDPNTGATDNLLTGLSGPNAVEIDDTDTIYFTDYGVVRKLELSTGEATTLAEGFIFPNGLSLDEDHDTLYIADNLVGIFRMSLEPGGTWSEPDLVIEAGPYAMSFDALEVDACGNLYVLGFDNGALYRFDPVTFEPTLLIDFPQPTGAGYNAIHWGSGVGGWRRDVLYVTNRDQIFGAEVGVPGRDQPVDAVP